MKWLLYCKQSQALHYGFEILNNIPRSFKKEKNINDIIYLNLNYKNFNGFFLI